MEIKDITIEKVHRFENNRLKMRYYYKNFEF